MDKKVINDVSIDLVSLVNSHERPFVIIDKNYRILAVNKPYEQRYGIDSKKAIGKMCYQVSHGKSQPCSLEGEECPHEHIFHTGQTKVCTHIHCDADHHMHHVKVTAVPLNGSNDELLLGECIEDITPEYDGLISSDRMVGEAPIFLTCVEQLNIAASSDAPVLLQGETGTGKELAAEFIHSHSSRNMKPFQIVDCAVLTENLFESEMFGHVAGAYTSSIGEKHGLFELTAGGTIFLDEIGDMPISQQVKLLRVLETGQYRRVGGEKMHKADFRIVCATNRHLWESVQAGTFREDLYYRIACLNIRLPSLRERLDDIPVLARNLLEGINRSMRCSHHFLPGVDERLKNYDYRGNIRELRNIIFIAVTHSHNRKIDAVLVDNVINNLPRCYEQEVLEVSDTVSMSSIKEGSPEKVEELLSLKEIEKNYIISLLKKFQGNRKQTAKALGICERTMYRKLNELGLS